jgi:hypothetical protein
MATNIYEDLKKALKDFKDFLDANTSKIKPAIAPLNQLTGGRATQLIDKLIDLMNKLKIEIGKLDPSVVPGLDDVTKFTQSAKTLLETAKNLLPDQATTINEVLAVVDVVSGLPSLSQIKDEILNLIQAIINDLQTLKS